jgi:hypothetical protein
MRTLAILFSLAGSAFGCECRSLTVCELVQQPTIFIGEAIEGGVTSIREDPWYSKSDHVRFRVVESFRGLPKDVKIVDMDVSPTFGMCSPNPYFPGRTYLVAPGKREGKFYDGGCFTGRDVNQAADTVSYLREYFAGKSSLNVRGQVAVARDWDLVEYLLIVGKAKPLPGVRVWTSKDSRTYSALTDAKGRYSLTVPSRGLYEVKAALSPYESDGASVRVAEGGCTVRDFALQSGSSISGLVWDGKGHPVRNAKVGLIDLDLPAGERDRHVWLLDAYTEEPDQSFLFKNVPMGRYLLVFNPDGPRSGERDHMPFESTYYPHASTRRDAQTIEVTSTGVRLTTKDLVIGKPVGFRPVVVRVHFPYGAPMTTAAVYAVGEPIEEGGVPWTFFRVAGSKEEGVVRFQAPANRKLRIEIRDWHGRDLKKAYRSTHAAGMAAIDQEFVIVP